MDLNLESDRCLILLDLLVHVVLLCFNSRCPVGDQPQHFLRSKLTFDAFFWFLMIFQLTSQLFYLVPFNVILFFLHFVFW